MIADKKKTFLRKTRLCRIPQQRSEQKTFSTVLRVIEDHFNLDLLDMESVFPSFEGFPELSF